MSETKSLNDKSIEEDSGVDVVPPKVLQAKGVSDCVPARTGTCEDLNMVVLQTFGHLGVKRQPAQHSTGVLLPRRDKTLVKLALFDISI